MEIKDIIATDEYKSIVEDYRGMCLWFASDPMHPKTASQLEWVLSSIESNGDMSAYKRAGRIRQWL